MGLEKLRFDFWDGADMIALLVDKWKPEGCKSEKQCEISLYEFLHDNLTDLQVTRQFASGRVRADIAVEGKVIIEIKNNLDTNSEYHRLVGQMSDYDDWAGAVFVVLCGVTDRNLLKELRKQLERRNNGYTLFPDEKFRLFEK